MASLGTTSVTVPMKGTSARWSKVKPKSDCEGFLTTGRSLDSTIHKMRFIRKKVQQLDLYFRNPNLTAIKRWMGGRKIWKREDKRTTAR